MDKNKLKKEHQIYKKNRQGITNDIEGTGGRMYATDSVLYPVQSFEKYLFKRHAGTDFSCIQKTSFQMTRQYGIRTNPWGLKK